MTSEGGSVDEMARRGAPGAGGLRWWRQPALHFVFIACLLLALDAVRTSRPEREHAPAIDEATVVARLQQEFRAARGRTMTSEELTRALDEHRFEQALFETALETGLYKTDPIVRRRLVQRMQFLIEDVVQVPKPRDDDLRALVDRHSDRFPQIRQLTFDHVFFARSRHGGEVESVAREARHALLRGEVVESDPFPRRLETRDVGEAALARVVGAKKAEAFFQVRDGDWSEPIASAYGVHLVRPKRRRSRPPRLSEVRARASALWQAEQQKALGRRFVASFKGGQ